MTFTLVFLALIMGAFVFWLVRQTINVQPWAVTGELEALTPGLSRIPTSKLALIVLICVIGSLFALFISAYTIRMEYSDWRPLHEPALLWLNTGLLALGSVALELCKRAAIRQEPVRVQQWLLGAGVMIVLFMVGQGFVWRELNAAGYYAVSNPANAFFFTLTALHVLHLLGGLVYQGRTTVQAFREIETEKLILNIELSAIYSHFLLFVWVALFILLLQT